MENEAKAETLTKLARFGACGNNIFFALQVTGAAAIIAGFIVWIWAGWWYGWRTMLSGIVFFIVINVIQRKIWNAAIEAVVANVKKSGNEDDGGNNTVK